tara:strand:- start:284 stop:502 length:219 start_codon:yes stop_codon:yes gene_type:complete
LAAVVVRLLEITPILEGLAAAVGKQVALAAAAVERLIRAILAGLVLILVEQMKVAVAAVGLALLAHPVSLML